jgi:hypothetical protein
VSFARLTASSSEAKEVTGATGPKISSVSRTLWGTPVSTVGR